MRINPEHPEQFLSMIDNYATNCHFSLDLNDPYHLVLKAENRADEMPVIYADYDSDDKYFWYNVHMEFPSRLMPTNIKGHFHSMLNDWTSVAAVADYLDSSMWAFDTEYED